MTEDQKRALLLFISEFWSNWEEHCKVVGEDAEAIYKELGGEE